MQSSILSPPMVYITHKSSKYSIFETLRSMDTYPILTSIEYLRVFVLVLSVNTCEYRICTRSIPWVGPGLSNKQFQVLSYSICNLPCLVTSPNFAGERSKPAWLKNSD